VGVCDRGLLAIAGYAVQSAGEEVVPVAVSEGGDLTMTSMERTGRRWSEPVTSRERALGKPRRHLSEVEQRRRALLEIST
jgi:hypothetical protein